ncbi:MAG: hypothetical protein JW861_04145 [Bacteroidales bacterium]|nr:hypothetical protein [Bacteroidales bacterium]
MRPLITIMILYLAFFAVIPSEGQEAFQHVSNSRIYNFLDELAMEQIITINSAAKPYSRMFIAGKLAEAAEKRELLNERQQKELDFYLLDYLLELRESPSYPDRFDLFRKNSGLATAINPLGVFYKDSIFTLSLKPIWGIQYFVNDSGSIFHRWGGAEAYAYVGKHWSFYANLRDNSESERLIEPSYFTNRQGGPYKVDTTGGDYSEMRGGLVYTWKWGSFGVMKDHFVWGNNYNGSNIFSGRTPSFAQVRLAVHPVKWLEFNYVHGWLVSEIVDTNRSYTYHNKDVREVFYPKYLAANMFTVTPFKHLQISFGNSIVYSDLGVHPAYLIPVMFYKSIDHTLNGTNNQSGQNSQMYFDVSSRQLKHLHLYTSVFIDELAISRITKPDEHNFISYKAGGRLSNFPLGNLALTTEFTYTLPLTYQHRIPTTTFESNYYSLGHYLRDNSREFYAAIEYKPIRGLWIGVSYLDAIHGDDFDYNEVKEPDRLPALDTIVYKNQAFDLRVNWEFINNAYLFAGWTYSDITDTCGCRSPGFYVGRKNTFTAGFNIGF